ncbi:MAG: sugar porter family MFS transporter [Caulobacteraceae bacterium]|nr:sugar porter family MFS transporter [Caulobacteraceae bacterium]
MKAENRASNRALKVVASSPRGVERPAREALTAWLMVVLAAVIFAGGLFGYDQGVISSALPGITRTFSLSLFMTQVVTSYVTLGALVGSFIGGALSDLIGRKRAMLVAGLLFVLGAAMQWSAPGALILVVGRFVVGVGVGVAAVAAPLYAAELAPATLRGRFISSYQLAITIGIFLAYLVNAQLARAELSTNPAWRTMLGAAAVPGVIMVLIALIAPESPRWLMMRGRRAAAERVALDVQPGIDVDARLEAIEASLLADRNAGSWRELFSAQWRRPLLVAVGLAVFQQITGINAIIYYANQIFEAAGFTTEASRAAVTAWAIGGVNVVSTLIAIAFIDHIGRRMLLLAGLIGMGASLIVAGAAFQWIAGAAHAGASNGPTAAGIVTVFALVVFIISFAFSLGPVVWTVINEVFPARVRGRGVALATAVNWGSAYVVSQFFLSLVHAIGSSLTFWLFAAFCVVGWIWIYRAVPETKRQSLEQIQDMWSRSSR